MAKKESYIAFIKDLLRKGIVDRQSNLSRFCKKFQTTDRTFDTYWKAANKEYSKELSEIEYAKKKKEEKRKDEENCLALLAKDEALLILAKMARKEDNSDKDRRGAIEVICKIEGWLAPTKVANTDGDGNYVEPTTTILRLTELINAV
jgi:hypothetical protein